MIKVTSEHGPAVLHRRENAGELIAYSRPHLRASVSLNLKMFVDGAAVPDHLTITAPGLRVPISPHERQAEKAATARLRADTAQTLAQTYQRVAARHEARLARLRGA